MLLALALAPAMAPSAEFSSTSPPWVVIEPPEFRTSLSLRDVSLCEASDGALVLAWSRGQKGIGTRLRIARSIDVGCTWERIAELEHISGATLFAHGGRLWLLGVDGPGRRGALVVRRSDDGGRTWTRPEDEHSGLLRGRGEYLSDASAVQFHGDRIYKLFGHPCPSLERNSFVADKRTHAFVASSAVDADWLEARNWRFSGEVPLDGAGASFESGGVVLLQPVPSRLVVTGIGHDSRGELPFGLRVEDDGHRLVESREDRLWKLPAGACAPADAVDPRTWRHVVLVAEPRPLVDHSPPSELGESLSLYSSQNQKQWELRTTLLRDLAWNRYRFSDAAWILRGEDLLAAICMSEIIIQEKAFDWSESLVFLRVPRFRERTESTPPLLDVQERLFR